MKITKQQLKRLIKEELAKLQEGEQDAMALAETLKKFMHHVPREKDPQMLKIYINKMDKFYADFKAKVMAGLRDAGETYAGPA